MLKKLLVVGCCFVLCGMDAFAMISQEKGKNSADRGHWSCSVSPELSQDNVLTDTRYLVGTMRLVNDGFIPNFAYVVPEIAALFPKVMEKDTDKSDKTPTVSMTSGSFSLVNETTYPRPFETLTQGQASLSEQK